MRQAKPPRRLPPGLRPLWHLLHEADESAASRQVLAARLGVSTSTLQRLLVSGELPAFRSSATTRELRSWTRTLTRLAIHFGHEPRAWIEGAGIRWDTAIAAACEVARQGVRRRSARGARGRAGSDDTPWPPFRDEAAGEVVLSAAIAPHGPFSIAHPALGVSFLERILVRLVGAAAPGASLAIGARRPTEPLASLRSPRARLHLVAGVPETVHDRARGFGFVSIPGFRIPLAAAVARPAGEPPRHVSWDFLLEPHLMPALRVVTLRGSAAEGFLRGQCRWPDERLVPIAPGEPAAMAAALLAAVSSGAADVPARAPGPPALPLVLVAGEEELHRVRGALPAALRLDEVTGACEVAPAHPLAIACAPGAGEWTALLELARERELLGSAARATARLYAAFLASMAFEADAPLRGRRLAADPALSADFMDEVARHFVHVLVAAPPVLPWPAAPAVTPPEARRAALARAAAFLPEACVPRFEDALGALVLTDPQLCQSCSASIPHHRGVSTRYCRFCSDERGELRPRAEVERLLAGWLRAWNRGVTVADAAEGALRFMAAMPAWSHGRSRN